MAERPAAAAEVEEALAVLDTYHRQLEALSRQIQFLQALQVETRRARNALSGLREEESSEILLPVGANMFVYAEAKRKDKVVTGIGAGLSVEKTPEEAEKGLVAREEEIAAEIGRMSEAAVRLQQEASTLEEQIQARIPGR